MNNKSLASKLLDLDDAVIADVCKLTTELNSIFSASSTNNEKACHESNMHSAMVSYIIASRISSKWKKEYDNSKRALDSRLADAGYDPSGVPGSTNTLFKTNAFSFSKRQNVNGTTTLVTDLVNALARLGVEKDIIDEALKKATKPKRGNVYYEVTTIDE